MTLLAAAMLTACGLTPEAKRAAIEDGIMSNAESRELWLTVKREFPQDYDILLSQLEALDINQMQDQQVIKNVTETWLLDFYARIMPDAGKAPAAEMLAWSAADTRLFEALQKSSVETCASMAMGMPIAIDPGDSEANLAIAARNKAIVIAAAAGQADPQSYGEPEQATFDLWSAAIAARGIEPELQASLASEEEMARLSQADQCRLGVAVQQAVTDLPDEIEPEMAAYMLAPY